MLCSRKINQRTMSPQRETWNTAIMTGCPFIAASLIGLVLIVMGPIASQYSTIALMLLSIAMTIGSVWALKRDTRPGWLPTWLAMALVLPGTLPTGYNLGNIGAIWTMAAIVSIVVWSLMSSIKLPEILLVITGSGVLCQFLFGIRPLYTLGFLCSIILLLMIYLAAYKIFASHEHSDSSQSALFLFTVILICMAGGRPIIGHGGPIPFTSELVVQCALAGLVTVFFVRVPEKFRKMGILCLGILILMEVRLFSRMFTGILELAYSDIFRTLYVAVILAGLVIIPVFISDWMVSASARAKVDPKFKKKLWASTLSSALLVVIIMAGRYYILWMGRIPSQDGINRVIVKMETYNDYRIGRDYVMRLDSIQKPTNFGKKLRHNPIQHSLIMDYLEIKFAATLTDRELTIMRQQGSIPFNSMSEDQRAALLKLVQYSGVCCSPEQTAVLLRRGGGLVPLQIECLIPNGDGTAGRTCWGIGYRCDERKMPSANSTKDVVKELCDEAAR